MTSEDAPGPTSTTAGGLSRARLEPTPTTGLVGGLVTAGLHALAILALVVGDGRSPAVAVAVAGTDRPVAFTLAAVGPGLVGGAVARRMAARRADGAAVATLGVAAATKSVASGALTVGYRSVTLLLLARYSPWLVPGMWDRPYGPLDALAADAAPWLFALGYSLVVVATTVAGYALTAHLAGAHARDPGTG